ncbi:ABC transporter ATP-binding protein [Thiohalophilus thiocyanatoxydans]|uniref:ABC-type dipeptide transporter n=1 Tax=Thiohalophilus thiocyanatoxydans TaxID=381308 RepID=A0A4R8IHL0_9GAMM|nr:ABC transporter ATP-binding protein [Thiohalophilus thiocyanatoxydans]TDY00082.1 peptide/nickel transport system ATP-binding protein [Thiohalophilus thiocyanatoxydans]
MTLDNDTPLLEVDNLKTWFPDGDRTVRAVDGVSFTIRRGETCAILGESGCGKSITALSLMQLVPAGGRIVSGEILFHGQDLLQYSERQMRTVRGNRIAMIFQEPMTSLNPVLTTGEQIAEVLQQHLGLKGDALRQRVEALLHQVGIPDPHKRQQDYPHQLSGGMKQRIMIAMALAAEPELLIADEPTTALDVTIQAQVLDLLRELQQQHHMAMLLITHDLAVVADRADKVAVMYAGQIVELAPREQFFAEPRHPYTRKLFAAVPGRGKRRQKLEVIKGSVPTLDREFSGCRFADRCEEAWPLCRERRPAWTVLDEAGEHGVRCHRYDPDVDFVPQVVPSRGVREAGAVDQPPLSTVLQTRDLKVHFPIRKGLFKRIVGRVYAVDGIDLNLYRGRTTALVGESGCGKTTVGKALLQLIEPTAGQVDYLGQELTTLGGARLRRMRKHLQIIFQDPFASMNPRMMVGNIIEEGMLTQGVMPDEAERTRRIDQLLEQVGLSAEARQRYPHEFSGGQRQRICIARALALEPDVIVCDEPTSALDVSVQAQTLNLLKQLQQDYALSYLFITHSLSVVEYLADDIAVMYLGRIVERGPVEQLMSDPKHPYTQALLSAVPTIEKQSGREVIKLEGELPSPIDPPGGCHFHPRCPQAMAVCKQAYPGVTQLDGEREVRCYLYEEKGRGTRDE